MSVAASAVGDTSTKPAAAPAGKAPASSPGKPQAYAFSPYQSQSQATVASPAAPSAVAQLMSHTPTNNSNGQPQVYSDYYNRFPSTRQVLNLDVVNSRLLGLGVKTLDGTAMGSTTAAPTPPSQALTADRISQEFKSRLKHASSSPSVQQQLQTPTLVNLLHTAQPSKPQPASNAKAATSIPATPITSPVATPSSAHMQQPHSWPYHPSPAVYGGQPAMMYSASQHPNTPPMMSPMYAYSMAMPAYSLPTTPTAAPISTLKPARHRRKAQELAENERWSCDQGCGKIYRLTSTQSIKQHQRTCKKGQQHVRTNAKRRKLHSDSTTAGGTSREHSQTSREGTDVDTSAATTPQRLSNSPEKSSDAPDTSHQRQSLHPIACSLLLTTLALVEWQRMPGLSGGTNLLQLAATIIPRLTAKSTSLDAATAPLSERVSSTSASTATCTTSHSSSSSSSYLFPNCDPTSKVSVVTTPPLASTWSSTLRPSTALSAIVQQQQMLGRSTDPIDTDDDSPLSSDNDDN